jgi:hypothetical protein
MRNKYDFSKGIRGAHFEQYRQGHTVRLVDEAVVVPSPTKRKNDTQLTELAGRFALISQLTKDGLEVALPMRDRGVDLIAYVDLDEQGGAFVACPIQLKVTTGRRFALDRKYARIANLLLVYVWDVDQPQPPTYALTYKQALKILEASGYSKSPSWKSGKYSISPPGVKLMKMLEPFLMKPEGWRDKILSTVSAKELKIA